MGSTVSIVKRMCHLVTNSIQKRFSDRRLSFQLYNWARKHKEIDVSEVLNFNLRFSSIVKIHLSGNPKTFQEKLMWLNVYEVPWSEEYGIPLKSVCADRSTFLRAQF